ncbi:MAG: VTT domain-containing protein [Ruthenibacterium sp.]
MKHKIRQYAGAAFSLVVLAGLALFAVTYHRQIWLLLTQQSARDTFVAMVRGSGFTGLAAFLGLQVLQVVIAVIPGEPVELMGGALYGTWGGLAACMAGLFIGSAAVYFVIRLMGASSMDASLLHKYRFLRDDTHVYYFLFLLYFIPGTPKDILLYIGPFLPVRPAAFFAIAMLARIPSVLTSTYAGANLISGDWRTSLAVFAVTGVLALLGIWQQENILRLLQRHKAKKTLEKTSRM